jgi:aspartate aminotransferase-like enzyme
MRKQFSSFCFTCKSILKEFPMTQHIKLFTPGPVMLMTMFLDALSLPVMRHYGPDWMPVHVEMDELLHRLFQTKNDMYVVPGPASAVLDMAIGSVVAR